MKNFWKLGCAVPAVLLLAFQMACGSSSTTAGTTGTTGTTGGGTTTEAKTVTITNLTTLPNLDFSLADITTNIAVAPKSKGLFKEAAAVGTTSSAGCMALKFFKPTAINGMKQAEAFKCLPEKTQAAANSDSDATNDVSVPTGQYNHYQISMPQTVIDTANISSARARVGNLVSGDNTTFKMNICVSTDGTTYFPAFEMNLTGDNVAKTWSGFVTSHSADSSFNKVTFDILMNSAAALSTDFDIANVDSLSTTGYFGREPQNFDTTTIDVTSDTTYTDGFRLNFGYWADGTKFPDFPITSSDPINQTIGTFSDPAVPVSGLMYSIFNNSVCAAQMTYSLNNVPVFNDSEACDVTQDPPLVVDSSTVPFGADVATFTLPDTINVPEDLNDNVAFADAWDCTAASGSSFVEIDGTDIDYQSCLNPVIGFQTVDTAADCFPQEGGGGGGDNGGGDIVGTYAEQNGTCVAFTDVHTITLAGSAGSYTLHGEGDVGDPGPFTFVEGITCSFNAGPGGTIPCTCDVTKLLQGIFQGSCDSACTAGDGGFTFNKE